MDREEKAAQEMADKLGAIGEKLSLETKTFLVGRVEEEVDEQHMVAMVNFVTAELLGAALAAMNIQLAQGRGKNEARMLAELLTEGVLPDLGEMLRTLGVGDVINLAKDD